MRVPRVAGRVVCRRRKPARGERLDREGRQVLARPPGWADRRGPPRRIRGRIPRLVRRGRPHEATGRQGESGGIAAAAFGGVLLIAAGGLAIAGFQFTAADTAGDVPATVTQALAALNRDFFFLLDGGVLIAVFAAAAATLRHAASPRWYGYLSIAVGLIFLTPAFAVAFPAFGVWTLLLSLLTFRADSPSIRRSPAPLR
jgi:hypothetical protein